MITLIATLAEPELREPVFGRLYATMFIIAATIIIWTAYEVTNRK